MVAAITYNLSADCTFLAELTPLLAAIISDAHNNPSSVEEVQSHSNWLLWQQAMDCEMNIRENLHQ